MRTDDIEVFYVGDRMIWKWVL